MHSNVLAMASGAFLDEMFHEAGEDNPRRICPGTNSAPFAISLCYKPYFIFFPVLYTGTVF